MRLVCTVGPVVVKTLERHNICLMRQALLTEYDPKPGVSISSLAWEYPPGYLVPEHAHGSDQVVYATSGVMEISAGQSLWVTPPRFAVWIPARTYHRIRMPRAVSMRTLYLRRGLATELPENCTVLHVAPLLRELIVETVRIGDLLLRDALHCALRDLILFYLRNAPAVPTFVTLPKDPRALEVAKALMAEPAQSARLAPLCRKAGISVRTMERVYLREVGMSFDDWRRQVRLMKAVELLVSGCAVKDAAARVGYRQASSFVEMFRQTMGTTPKVWAAALPG
jgi:AraC-like DNA-binding protein